MFNKYLYNCKNKTNNCLTINLIQDIPLNMELHKKINVKKIVVTIFPTFRTSPYFVRRIIWRYCVTQKINIEVDVETFEL